MITHYRTIKAIAEKKALKGLRGLLHTAIFHSAYSKVFSQDILLNAEYICQFDNKIPVMFSTYQARMDYAEDLIRKYARAKFVITSRIHCALPCTGLGTPVVFIQSLDDDSMSSDRFGGLTDLFNIILWKKDRLVVPDGFKKITLDNLPQPRTEWKKIAENLIRTCTSFVRDN